MAKTAGIYLLQYTDKQIVLPTWLASARTSLLSKHSETELAKNSKPIASINFMYEIYKSCLNSFLSDHCQHDNIIHFFYKNQ